MEPIDFYANNETGTDGPSDSSIQSTYEILDEDGNRPIDSNKIGSIGGIRFQGDTDNDLAFGTNWND